jgi:hypothetical protein
MDYNIEKFVHAPNLNNDEVMQVLEVNCKIHPKHVVINPQY